MWGKRVTHYQMFMYKTFLSYFISLNHFFLLSRIGKCFSIWGVAISHSFSVNLLSWFFTGNELKIPKTIDYSLQSNHCLKQIVGPRSLLNFNQITFGQVRIREIVLHKWSRGKSMNNNDLTPHCQPWWSSTVSSGDIVTEHCSRWLWLDRGDDSHWCRANKSKPGFRMSLIQSTS